MTGYDTQPGPSNPELSPEQREADEVDLRAGLSGLAAVVGGSRTVEELLTEVAEFAGIAIPGAEGAGVNLVRRSGGKLQIAASAVTTGFTREIDILQYEVVSEGSCITCMHARRPIVSGSLRTDRRWRRFGARAAELGVHSVLSLPLMFADEVVGSINSYARDRDAFIEHAVRLGSMFAGPAAVSAYNAQLLAQARERAEQLQRALGSRAVIDQAIGIVRGRTGGSADDAFDRLRRMTPSQSVRLAVIAQRVVEEAVRRARVRDNRR